MTGSEHPAPRGDSPRRSTEPPRFAVGEDVMVRSAIDPSRNTDRTRIIDRQWFEGEAQWGWYRGWQYVVACHLDAWAVEPSLRPRPEPASDNWLGLQQHFRQQGHRRRESARPVVEIDA